MDKIGKNTKDMYTVVSDGLMITSPSSKVKGAAKYCKSY